MNNVFEQGVTKTFHLNLLMLMETSIPTPHFEPKKNVVGLRLEEFL